MSNCLCQMGFLFSSTQVNPTIFSTSDPSVNNNSDSKTIVLSLGCFVSPWLVTKNRGQQRDKEVVKNLPQTRVRL